jgi:hypothetical protein
VQREICQRSAKRKQRTESEGNSRSNGRENMPVNEIIMDKFD